MQIGSDVAAAAATDLNLPGLKGKASVQFDDRMVPHIFAENTADLFLLQGYITARDRLSRWTSAPAPPEAAFPNAGRAHPQL